MGCSGARARGRRCCVIHAFRASARVQFYDSRFYERAYFCRKVHSAVLGGNCGSTKANISGKRLYESAVLGKLFCANEVLRNERLLESAVLRNVPLRECGFRKKRLQNWHSLSSGIAVLFLLQVRGLPGALRTLAAPGMAAPVGARPLRSAGGGAPAWFLRREAHRRECWRAGN